MNDILCVSHIPSFVVLGDNERDLRQLQNIFLSEATLLGFTKTGALMEWLEDNDADLLLLDFSRLHEEVEKQTLLKRVRAIRNMARVPVILFTDAIDAAKEEHFLHSGAKEYLLKPFFPDVVRSRVNHVLRYEYLHNHLTQEVSHQVALAEKRLAAGRRLFQEMVLALAKTIDAKDRYTSGHSERVADYARSIAERAGEPKETLEEIYYIGLVHDIGKIGIPKNIIDKPGRLTDDEYTVIQSHTIIGASILQNIDEVPWFAIGAHYHHERYDGQGYPQGLKGEEIPKLARIIAVADAYDAMTSCRSYRSALPQDMVRAELIKGRGHQFDPYYADIMISMIDEDPDYSMREQTSLVTA
ncbi:MAG: HD domain-containing protein [Desulfovibrio sp.]|nr:HD domain-containing protein [Desulfovibrio sp.]